MVTRSQIINQLQTARDRGAVHLLAQQHGDGSFGEPAHDGLGPYYKSLWALTAAGEPEAANRLATWIARKVQTDEGDFAGPFRGALMDRAYPYPNAWIVAGAHKLGRFDISRRGAEFLLRMQHQEDGGFRTQRDNEAAPQDIQCSAQSGNALLLAGHLGVAKNIGRFLRTLWEAQPDPEHALYIIYKPGAGIKTDFPDERQRLGSIQLGKSRQAYFNMGIAAAFLARLSMATCDPEWVDLGKRYLELAFKFGDDMYETAQVGKVGWGAALVYACTGEQRYLELAERVGEALVAQQTDTGGWDNTGGYVNDAIRTEVTAEFIVLLDEMIGGLAAVD